MIRMAVSENEVLEFLWRTAKPADRLKDGGLLTRKPGVDECQTVLALDQKGVCHSHREDMHAVGHTLYAHGRTPCTVYGANAQGCLSVLAQSNITRVEPCERLVACGGTRRCCCENLSP